MGASSSHRRGLFRCDSAGREKIRDLYRRCGGKEHVGSTARGECPGDSENVRSGNGVASEAMRPGQFLALRERCGGKNGDTLLWSFGWRRKNAAIYQCGASPADSETSEWHRRAIGKQRGRAGGFSELEIRRLECATGAGRPTAVVYGWNHGSGKGGRRGVRGEATDPSSGETCRRASVEIE